MSWRLLLRGLGLLASLAAIGFLVRFSGLSHLLDSGWIDSEVRDKGLMGEVAFVGMGALIAAVGLPRQAVCFLGGYAFGFLGGFGLALAASLLGCISAFYYARLFGRSLVQARFAGRIRRIDDFLRERTFSMSLLIRLLPVGSNLLTNLAAGVASVRGLPFFAGSALGYIPQTVVFALLGSGIHFDPVLRVALSVALFLISGVIGLWLYRAHRHGHHALDDATEQEIDSA